MNFVNRILKQNKDNYPYKHKEKFDNFLKEFNENRRTFKGFAEKNSSSTDDYKEQLRVMGRMHYFWTFIICHLDEAKDFINLFDAMTNSMHELDPEWSSTQIEEYKSEMVQIISLYQQGKSSLLKVKGIIDETEER